MTCACWQLREVGDAEEGLAHPLEEGKATPAGDGVIIHNHNTVEKSVNRRSEPQENPERLVVVGFVTLKQRLHRLASHLRLEVKIGLHLLPEILGALREGRARRGNIFRLGRPEQIRGAELAQRMDAQDRRLLATGEPILDHEQPIFVFDDRGNKVQR